MLLAEAATHELGPDTVACPSCGHQVKGNVPDTPFKTGHITFLTGPANLLGEPGRKGHLLAAEEINAAGGVLGRKIKLVIEDGKATLTSQHGEQFELHKLERRSETIGAKPPAMSPYSVE